MMLPFSTGGSCLNLPISGITASGQQESHGSKYAIDNNLNTRWSKVGRGSWIQGDLGVQKIVCNVDIAWYLGNSRQYNFVISLSNDGSTFTNIFTGISSGKTSSFETYSFTTDTAARFVRITVNGNTANNLASINELRINGYMSTPPPPPPPPGNAYDNFEGSGTYTLSDGQTSPNGKWVDFINGGGVAGVQDDGTGTGNKVFFMYPKTSTSSSESNSGLVTSTQKWSDFDLGIDVKTVKQLRQNSAPNAWETAWVFFRYTDTFHYYSFSVKPNGVELAKKDCNTCTDQQVLVTPSSPTLKIGAWSNWKISAIGNHIVITVDGNKVIDYTDQTMSPKLSSGAVAMYNQDASAQFDNVNITPSTPPPPPPPPPTSANYDDFEGPTYSLGYGQVSPNGKWKETYAESAGTVKDPQTGNNAMYLTTGKATNLGQTYSSLVLSTAKFKDFDLSLDVKTVQQLRTPTPHYWENAWVMWNRPSNYDDYHYYAYTLFSDGRGQLEKKDNDIQDDSAEIFLAYSDHPSIKYNTWQKWRIMVTGTATGTPTIQIWLDGVLVINYTDNKPSIPRNSATMLQGGSIVLYNENSIAAYDNVNINPL
jgi:F5/8 type C domain/3-keto-disaccharide hydrolase